MLDLPEANPQLGILGFNGPTGDGFPFGTRLGLSAGDGFPFGTDFGLSAGGGFSFGTNFGLSPSGSGLHGRDTKRAPN